MHLMNAKSLIFRPWSRVITIFYCFTSQILRLEMANISVLSKSFVEPVDAQAESEAGDDTLLISFIAAYSLIILLIIGGNGLVATILIRYRLMFKSVVNWYLLSLVISRIMIGLLVVPARITSLFSEEYLLSIICKLCHFVGHGSSVSSVFSIVGIAISTYWQLVKGSDLLKTQKSNFYAVVVIWIMGFTYSIQSPIITDLSILQVHGVDQWACTVDPDYYFISRYLVLCDCFLMFIIPFMITLFCYIRVIKMLATRLESNKKEHESISSSNLEALLKIRMIVTLMTLFTICSLAPVVCKMYLSWDGPPFTDISIITNGIYMFSYSNAWYNIIVFFIFRKDIRHGCINMFCRPKTTVGSPSRSVSKEAIIIQAPTNELPPSYENEDQAGKLPRKKQTY